MKVRTATSNHRGNKIAGNNVRQFLNRRAAALGFADHADDLRQQSVAADAFRAHDEAAGAVDGAAGDFAAFCFLDGNRFAGDH